MNIEERKLGTTDLTVPALGLGTWGLCSEAYGPVSDVQAQRTLQRALDLGMNLFDMAPCWGPDGASERAVAEAIQGRRDEAVLVSRAGRTFEADGVHIDFSAEGVRASCVASLQRLGTEHLDVLLLHNPEPELLEQEEPRQTCEALLREGKLRAWGVSTSDVHCARAALRATAPVLCLPHHMLRPDLLWSIAEEVQSLGAGVLVSSPLCHGLLTGRWSAHKGFASNDHRQRRWSREALAARVAEVQRFRSSWITGDMVSMASPALRFAVAEPYVGTALLGGKTPGQLELAVKALGELPYPVPEEAMAELRRQHGFG